MHKYLQVHIIIHVNCFGKYDLCLLEYKKMTSQSQGVRQLRGPPVHFQTMSPIHVRHMACSLMYVYKSVRISMCLTPRIRMDLSGNTIVEIRRSYGRLISTMGFPILVRWHLYIESGTWCWKPDIAGTRIPWRQVLSIPENANSFYVS